jgi:hypothetical protein
VVIKTIMMRRSSSDTKPFHLGSEAGVSAQVIIQQPMGGLIWRKEHTDQFRCFLFPASEA